MQERADEKRRLAELEGKNIEDVSDSDSDHELGPPLNQQCKTNEEPMEEETDNDVPDLEKVDIESMETLVGNSIAAFPKSVQSNMAEPMMKPPSDPPISPFESDMVDLTGLRAQSAPPKGFRNVEIELDSDGDSDESDNEFDPPGRHNEIRLDDLPDLNPAEPKRLAADDKSLLNIVQSKDESNPITEMLFTKVESTKVKPTPQKQPSSSKPLIQELDSDDELL